MAARWLRALSSLSPCAPFPARETSRRKRLTTGGEGGWGVRAVTALLLLLLPVALPVAGCNRAPAKDEAGGPVEITLWHPWGADTLKSLQETVRLYEKSQNKVRVRLVYSPTDLTTNQKFFTAVAANKPPDVSFVDGTQVAQWAEWNALQPLDGYMKRDGVKQSDFFLPCAKQCEYKGHIWALTECADPNFAFGWNKEIFRKAGLDPNKPPRTIADLDRIANACTFQKDGRITGLGVIPWGMYGSANSVFTWGWAFGGKFYDEKTQTITANDPKVVEALTWMVGYAKRLGITRINASTSSWGAEATDPFVTGQLAMTCMHISKLKLMRKYAPGMDYGMAPIPGTPDGEIGSSWIGGWCLGIPRGCAHPEAAWDFIRWMCTSKEGTRSLFRDQSLMPGYKASPAFADAAKDPRMRIFAQILKDTKHQRPAIPVQAFYMGALDRAVDRALYGKQTPQQALDQATAETQRELDLILGRKVQ